MLFGFAMPYKPMRPRISWMGICAGAMLDDLILHRSKARDHHRNRSKNIAANLRTDTLVSTWQISQLFFTFLHIPTFK